MPPLVPRQQPRYDAQGRLVGYLRTAGYVEADALQQAPDAVGKDVLFEGGARLGRVSDVIFELTTGEILAYEFTDMAGAAFYLPAGSLARETSSSLCFSLQARALIADEPQGLGETLQGRPQAEGGEFVILEEWPASE